MTTKAKKGSSSSSSSVPTIKSISYLDKGYGFKLAWNKVSKAYGYEIQYSTNKKFSDVYDDEGYVFDNMHKDVSKGSTSVNFKVGDKDPAADNTWYVRVRAEKSGGKYSGWSKTVSILTPERKDYLRLMDKAYGEMGITAQMTDIQKLAAIQNWIGNNWYYDADTEHEDAVGKYQIAKYHHNGCNSFANAFNYFANKAGIESYTIGGMRKKLSGGHYWNFICIQGKWFNYDCESGNGIGGFYPETRATEYYELDLESKKIYESKQPLGTHDEYISMNEQFKLLYPKCVNTIYK